MGASKYSAGTIFLQVVPVFRNVQRDIEKHAKDIDKSLGDEMEKSGRRAGERAGKGIGEGMEAEAKRSGERAAKAYAGHFESNIKNAVDSAEKEISRLDFKTATEKSVKNLDILKRSLKELKDTDFNVDFDSRAVLTKLEVIKATLATLAKGEHDINVNANVRKAHDDVERMLAFVDKEVAKHREFSLGARVETKQAERQIGAFEKKARASFQRASEALGSSMHPQIASVKADLDRLASSEFGIDVSTAEARAKITALSKQLREISLHDIDIEARVDAGVAMSELAAIRAAVGALDGKDIDIQVKNHGGLRTVATDAAAAGGGLSLFTAKGDAAASTFRSFNPIIAALAALLPTIGPAAAVAGGGLLTLVPILGAVGAGATAMIIGFTGIGSAVQALGQQSEQAGKNQNAAAKSAKSSANAIADAKRSIADAERSAARAAADAARAVARAQESSAETIRNALEKQKDAQKAYADSVKDVKKAEKELREARKEATKDSRDLNLDIKSNKLDIDQARVTLFNAQTKDAAVRADGSSTNLDKVESNLGVEQAKVSLEELLNKQTDLADKKAEFDKTGINGTKKVLTAEEKLQDSIDKQKKSYRDLQKTSRDVDKARRDGARQVNDALRAQKRTLADNNRSIAQAQQGLARAYQQAASAADATNASADKVDIAMSKLGPAGQKFAAYLFSLRKGFITFRDSIQEAMLPGVQRSMETFFSTYGPRATSFLAKMAGGMSDLTQSFVGSFANEGWTRLFSAMGKFGPSIQSSFGSATISLLSAFAGIMATTTPYTARFADALAALMDRFDRWAASAEGQKAFEDFLDYVWRAAPIVGDFILSFGSAFGALFKAMAPFGEGILIGMTNFFNWFSELDPDLIQRVATLLLGLVAGMQAVSGIGSILLASVAAFSTVLGRVVFVLAIALYNSKGFRDAIKEVGEFMLDHIGTIVAFAKVLGTAYLAFKALKVITSLTRAVMVGYSAASYGAAGATYAQGKAAKVAYYATRLWNKVSALARLAQEGMLTATIRLNAAIALQAAKQKAIMVLTKAWTTLQVIFNAVMSANPIMLTVIAIAALVAGLIYAYKHFSWFKDIVDKVWGSLVDGAQWLWEKVKPTLEAIGKVVKVLALAYFKLYFLLIKTVISLVFSGIKSAWNNILSPVFSAIGNVVKWLWAKVIKPYIEKWKSIFETVAGAIKRVWDKTLGPVFNTLFPAALNTLKGVFSSVVNGIGNIWDGLKEKMKTPLRFIIETVLNKGIIAGFNKIAKWVGQDGFDPIPTPDGLKASAPQKKANGGLLKFATGGVLNGYTPGRDVHRFVSPTGGRLELSGGEAVMRPEWTAAMGPEYVNHMNFIARTRGVGAIRKAMAYAKGGIINPLPGANIRYAYEHTYPGHDGIDLNKPNDMGAPYYAALPGKISYVGWNHGYGNAIFQDTSRGRLVYGHSSKVAVSAGQKVAAGQYIGNVGSTGNSSGPHLHFGFPGGTTASAYGLLSGAATDGYGKVEGGGKGKSIPGWIMNFVKSPIKGVKNWITGGIDKVKDMVSGHKLLDDLAHAPMTMAGKIANKALSIVPGWVKTAAGWAGNAAEVTGDVIGGAVNAGKDAAGWVGSHLGFAEGGILPYNGTMMYDNGGYLPPGVTSVVNMTGKPEPVFTDGQFKNMRGGQSADGVHYEPHFHQSDLTSEEVMGDFNFTIRKMRHGGVYEKVGR